MKTEEKEYYKNKLIEAEQIARSVDFVGMESAIAVFEKIATPLCYLTAELIKEKEEKSPALPKPKKLDREEQTAAKALNEEKRRLFDLGWIKTKTSEIMMLREKNGNRFKNLKTGETWIG